MASARAEGHPVEAVSVRFFGARVGGVFAVISALTTGGAALLTAASL